MNHRDGQEKARLVIASAAGAGTRARGVGRIRKGGLTGGPKEATSGERVVANQRGIARSRGILARSACCCPPRAWRGVRLLRLTEGLRPCHVGSGEEKLTSFLLTEPRLEMRPTLIVIHFFSQWYYVDLSRIESEDVRSRFVQCQLDDDTQAFLDRSTEKSGWLGTQILHAVVRLFLGWFITKTSLNGCRVPIRAWPTKNRGLFDVHQSGVIWGRRLSSDDPIELNDRSSEGSLGSVGEGF
ncbi:unnamed protein product [Ixodes persulcatus]